MLKYIFYTYLLVIFLLNSGCNVKDGHISSCETVIPIYSDFRNLPSFSSLRFYTHVGRVSFSHKGYNLWADSNFDYHSALQFNFIHKENFSRDQFCVNSVLLRLSLPLNIKQNEMLTDFIREISVRTGMDIDKLEKDLSILVKNGNSYELLSKSKHTLIRAGSVHHPYRGDFFMISIESEKNPGYSSH